MSQGQTPFPVEFYHLSGLPTLRDLALRLGLEFFSNVRNRYSGCTEIEVKSCPSNARKPGNTDAPTPQLELEWQIRALLDHPVFQAQPAELVFVERAGPHIDWNTRFFSIVLATSTDGRDEAGYQLSTAPRPREFDENTFEPSQSVVQSLTLKPGDIFSFNPDALVHWADPIIPTPASHLLLMQWDFGAEGRDLDAQARQAVERIAGRPMVRGH